jgi:hypothetical protein
MKTFPLSSRATFPGKSLSLAAAAPPPFFMLAAKAPSASGRAIRNRRNSRADTPKAPSFISNIATPDGDDQL